MNARQISEQLRDELETLNDRCCQLFDSWCERRSVIPLAYLLHGWPIPVRNEYSRLRVVNSLTELRQWHADMLSADDKGIIAAIVDAAVDISGVSIEPIRFSD